MSSTGASVTVVLPPPDFRLSANSRLSWQAKMGPRRTLRADAFLRAREAMVAAGRTEPMPRARVSYRFWLPDNRARDCDNLIATQKAALDGIEAAGLIASDSWQFLSIYFVSVSIDRKNPRVELVFFEV